MSAPQQPTIVTPENSSVANIVFKIQQTVFPRRIRVKDIFRDYDPLRSMRVTKPQFRRAMSSLNIKNLTVAEIDELGEFFKDGPASDNPTNSMKCYTPQDVNYGEFSDCVEEVFAPTLRKLEETPTAEVPRPGALLGSVGFKPNAVEGEANIDALNAVLHKLALLAKTRGIVFKYCFQDLDRSESTSLTVPRRGGWCTVPQFLRNFPFAGDVTGEEMDLLLQRYTGDIGGRQPGAVFNYQALHDDISELAGDIAVNPVPQSNFIPRPDGTEWTSKSKGVVEKIQAAVVEKRCRVAEYFIDFDNLRKGFCTVKQVNTVFSLLKLNWVSQEDFKALCDIYCRPSDGMFHYARFAAEIDSAFTKDELEREPLTRIGVTDGTTTLPARRNKAKLSEEEMQKIELLEAEIASRIKERRILLRPQFEDFDPIRRGHVTKSQFGRVMATCGFTKLDVAGQDLLCKKYCDLGNDREFNYMDFNYTVDPRPKEEDLAAWQSLQPYCAATASKYFEWTGNVTPFKSAAQGILGGGA